LTAKLATEGLQVSFAGRFALHDVSASFPANRITAVIGPSGSGKTTLLRSFNRMDDDLPGWRIRGRVLLDGEDVRRPDLDPRELRRRVAMVFQRPNPLPLSIFDNVAYGLRVRGVRDRLALRLAVQTALQEVGLWPDVRARLATSAFHLTPGSRQLLCIARALAVRPEVILLDEPCSLLDPAATRRIERLLANLKERYTVVIITHSLGQAARIADHCLLVMDGRAVEEGPSRDLLTSPRDPRTRDYLALTGGR
jgi:phosphate transport system ATP-binding protein